MALITHDSPFMKFMERFTDLFILNLLWLLGSLPLVTMGASSAAVCKVTMAMSEDREGSSLWKSYWKAFGENFRQATLVWILQLIGAYALYLDWQLISLPGEVDVLVLTAGLVSAAFLIPLFLYPYPLMVRYQNTLLNLLKNAYRIFFRYFFRTLLLLVVLVLLVAAFTWNTVLMFFGLLIGPMAIMYTISAMSLQIFKRIDAKV